MQGGCSRLLLTSGVSSVFAADTAVTRTAGGAWSASISRRWWIGRGPNGGYVAAILLRAMALELGDPDRAPRTLTVHFPAAPAEGPVALRCEVERRGRSVATVSARMEQDGRLVALALAAFAPRFEGPSFDETVMPEVPAPEALDPVPTEPPAPPLVNNLDLRWAVGPPPFSESERALAGGWMRLRDPEPLDAPVLTLLSDAWLPAPFARQDGIRPAPTIELTVHFRARLPPPGAEGDFCLGFFSSRLARDGFFEEDGELWSREGVLLAQSRQLALLLGPPGPAG